MPEITSSTEVPVSSRPDYINEALPQRLGKKQILGSFLKFMLQAGIPYTPMQKINVPTPVNVERLKGGKLADSEAPVVLEFQNLLHVTVTCRLDGIKINGEEVFVDLRYKKYEEMSHRERNKIVAIKQRINLITLFYDDLEKIGLTNYEGARYIPSLNKRILKRWVDWLFSRINELGRKGVIDVSYSAADLKNNIDRSIDAEGNIVKALREENENLKRKVLIDRFAEQNIVHDTQYPIISSLVSINPNTAQWIKDTLADLAYTLTTTTANKIGSKKVDKGSLIGFIVDSYLAQSKTLAAEIVCENLITIKHQRTLSKLHLLVNVTTSSEVKRINGKAIPISGWIKPSDSIFVLTVHLRTDTRVRCVNGHVFTLGNNNGKQEFTRKYFLPLLSARGRKITEFDWIV